MTDVKYSDTADGLSRMSKEQFRATYLKLEKEVEKRINKSSSCFAISLCTLPLCILPLVGVASMPFTTLYSLGILLSLSFLVFSISMVVSSNIKEFHAKDDLEILKRAAPVEARSIEAEIAYNNSKQRFLAESTELASRLGI